MNKRRAGTLELSAPLDTLYEGMLDDAACVRGTGGSPTHRSLRDNMHGRDVVLNLPGCRLN